MPLREFVDERQRRWIVWDVHPTLLERRERNVGPPRGVPERRIRAQSHPRVSTRLQGGWLAFEADDGERRRLSPIPAEAVWVDASEQQLRAWCGMAEPARPGRRLVE